MLKSLSLADLKEILGLTIKKDDSNKVITFLCELSAYLEDAPFNVSFNAPSSTGKSYIPTEIARLFPPEDVVEVGYCSPTAFFHDVGEYDKGTNTYVVDLSKKILVLLDQPHQLLLQHLRPLLSHDKKEIQMKITDKSQRGGLRTKNVILRGYPAVIFCSAGLGVDEQEATRFVLLSPETSQEKIRSSIQEKIKKEAHPRAYRAFLDADPKREELKKRIRAIRDAGIRDVSIESPEKLEKYFDHRQRLIPRYHRDIGRIIAIAKTLALLNLWQRDKSGSRIVASGRDIEDALELWESIAKSQELNLPPYVYQIYEEVILAAWRDRYPDGDGGVITGSGLTRREITQRHFRVYGRPLADWNLRQDILPMLENAGLIVQEADPKDRRRVLIYPTHALTISQSMSKNSEPRGGVGHGAIPLGAQGKAERL
jgi:hypothetical protein